MEPQVRFDEQTDGMAAHVAKVIEGVQQLVRQEVALAKAEIRKEWAETKQAGAYLGVAIAGFILGAMLAAFTVVHILSAAAGLPLWSAYGLVSVLFIGVGFGVWNKAKKRVKDIDPVPRQTIETLKENVQWITKQT